MKKFLNVTERLARWLNAILVCGITIWRVVEMAKKGSVHKEMKNLRKENEELKKRNEELLDHVEYLQYQYETANYADDEELAK